MSRLSRVPRKRALVLVVAAVTATAAFAQPATAEGNNNLSEKLRDAVTAEGVLDHLEAFDQIAADNGGTRASGTPGYAASRDYVVSQLEAAGYQPTVQAFQFPFFRQVAPSTFEQVAPTPTTYAEGTDFVLLTYSGSGDVTAPVQAVDLNLGGASTSGCEASDFAGFTPGNIALIRRGTCTFAIKSQNAQAAGASAVVIFNTNPGGTAFGGTLAAPVVTVPVVATSYAIGTSLDTAGAAAHIVTHTESEVRTTWNVFAETAYGDPTNVVMAGAHLDSVIAGPGINDNGSGSASVLEVAVQMAKVKPINRVRFAWWGAEELGLLGSANYVNNLSAGQLEDIALYLNFDMVSSPNYSLFVYDGDNSEFPVGPGIAAGPEGSGVIEDLFHDHFAGQGLKSAQTGFTGRSDYGPFIAKGIPAGGLFTGAEGVKTALQQSAFGGTAGVAFDVCYHQACDSLANVSVQALDYNSDAIAHAVLTYAFDTRSVNGEGKGHPVSDPDEHVDGQPIDIGGSPGGGGLHDDDHELPAS